MKSSLQDNGGRHHNSHGEEIDSDFEEEKHDFIDSLIDLLDDLCDDPNECDQPDDDFDDYAQPITLKP